MTSSLGELPYHEMWSTTKRVTLASRPTPKANPLPDLQPRSINNNNATNMTLRAQFKNSLPPEQASTDEVKNWLASWFNETMKGLRTSPFAANKCLLAILESCTWTGKDVRKSTFFISIY
jgi:hypothetical protein